jgi:aminoglycoside phosphotransferase family enzyme
VNKKQILSLIKRIENLLAKKTMPALFDPKILMKLFKAQSRCETNVSELYFTSQYVYKIKKPVNLGFVDFTKTPKRLSMTLLEYKLNKMISPQIYLQLIPIKIFKQQIRLGGKGKIIEYAIKMRRLPAAGLLAELLKKKKISRPLIIKIACAIAQMHSKFKPQSDDKQYGDFKVIMKNWKLILDLLKKDALGSFLSNAEFNKVVLVNSYLKKINPVLMQRVKDKKIQLIHGDLHAENVFIEKNKPYIVDVVLPLPQWIHGDVVRDVAALAMDLDAYGFQQLAKILVKEYVVNKKDETIINTILFYKIYWAAIRFWVNVTAYKNGDTKANTKALRYKKILLQYIKSI